MNFKMRSSAILLLLVGAAFANSNSGFENGKQYTYKIRSRTMAAINPQANQYTGLLIEGRLVLQPNGQETVRAKIMRPQYTQIHNRLDKGWDSEIPTNQKNMQDLALSNKPFEIKMRNGVVKDLIVDKNVPTWEVNLLKSIVSQLQVDTQGENIIESHHNQLPENNRPYASFKTMEDTVGGNCEVRYDITPLSERDAQNNPELVPMPELREDGHLIDVTKYKNYSNCNQRVSYNFNIDGRNDWEPSGNDNGNYLSRSTLTRIVVSGSVKKNIIQSSVTVNKVIHNAHAQDRKKEGMVASKMNITLHEVKDVSENIPAPSNPQSTGNLVYNYNTPSENESARRMGKSNGQGRHRHSHNSDESRESSDSRSTDSGSWEDNSDNYLEPRPSMTEAPEIPMSPLFIGNNGNSIRHNNKVDVVKTAKDIAQRIANDIQKPNSILEEETLERYTTLSKVIRTMSAEQIAQVQRELYQAKQSPNQLNQNNREENTRRKAWEVFRDAVAQSGTGPALVNIKQWIQNKQIKGMEAASVADNIARTARYPTPEFTDMYFDMVKLPETKEDSILQKSIVMSFADLVRLAAVDKRASHHRYPIHTFGRLYREVNKKLEQEYIPYLGEKLKSAIDSGDSEKVQAYITALGKTGHSRILSVFEPYLEGRKQVSEFQRNLMVLSLNKLGQLKPHHAQAVLNKIYMNTAESSDIRTSAVILLMETNPPTSMLQRMAQYTHIDTDKQVNSAVKSAIESLAQLDEQDNPELVNGARAALPLLTKEMYGPQYSKIVMKTIRNPVTGSKMSIQANWIGSEDSILAKGAYLRVQSSMKGVNVPDFEIGGSVSSTRNLYEFISRAMQKNNQNNNNKQKYQEQKYSPENVAKMLNIQGSDPKQLEGFIFSNQKFGNCFESYDNRTLEKLGNKLRNMMEDLKTGKNFDEIKLNNDEVVISFPTETGFPFRFTVRTPTLKSIEGKGNVENNSDEKDDNGLPKQALGVLKTDMTYSMKVQKRLSFIAPFEHQEYIAGMDRNVLIRLPIRSEVEVDQNKNEVRVKIQPNGEERDIKLVEYKAQPFTAKHDIFNLDPVMKDKNTQVLHKDRATQSRAALNDKNNQPALEMTWERQEKFTGDKDNQEKRAEKALEKLAQSLMSFYYPMSAGDEYQKYSVKYMPSNEDSLEVRVSHDSLITDNNEERNNNDENERPNAKSVYLSPSLDKRQRQEKLLKEATKNINSARANGLDIKVQVTGRYQSSLTVSTAHGRSNVDTKSRMLLSASAKSMNNQDYHLRVGIENKIPKIYSMDFEDILKANKEHRSSVEIVYGVGTSDQQTGKVNINAKAEQTEDRKNLVRQSNDAEKCNKKKNQIGNKMSEACQNARARAYAVDKAELTINFEDAPLMKNLALNTIDVLERMQNPLKTIKNRQDKEDKDKIKIALEMSTNDDKLDITVKTPEGKIRMNNVETNLLSNSDNPRKELFNLITEQDKVCNLDKTKITTFDNLRYPVELGQCWHVVLSTFPKSDPDMPSRQQEIPKNMHVTVLSRENNDRQKEFKVTLGDKEIELKRSSSGNPEAKINGQSVRLSKHKSHQEKKNDKVIFELFEAHDGSIKLVSEKFDFKMNYDGSRAEIKAGQRFRDSVRGLCGNFDGEYENDQETPKGCTLQRSEQFSATWALINSEKCEGPARENAQKAQQSKCFDLSPRPGNVVSEQEAGRRSEYSNKRNENENDSKQCTHHRTRVMKDNQQICFSTRPVPTCSSKCKAETTKEKPVAFHCVPRNSASEKIAQRVESGANPDLSQKSVTKTETLSIPTSCRA